MGRCIVLQHHLLGRWSPHPPDGHHVTSLSSIRVSLSRLTTFLNYILKITCRNPRFAEAWGWVGLGGRGGLDRTNGGKPQPRCPLFHAPSYLR